ncbi:ribosome maturation factor RimM [Thermosediminibacter oceani]|uniref:Ribosome maturation factor RimM n=1 Tax=Thermosediminibacter oceani (strain ATCC BAA-1034 / DSM 16646 / JW/IW-1228P) TaxID=555079 RepID=D9S353_THEOJ|nr:ribosome maturation factor RimM [Thermosediminibacter oceani]ADL07830.1 16S rRNA processing protein RimM [Thermosediminibacter oceani DSM 16646]
MREYIAIGRVLAPWGVRGQVKVEALTDDVNRFRKLKSVLVEEDEALKSYVVNSVVFLKKDFVALKLEGIDTVESAERLRGRYLMVHRKDAVKLPEGHYFICDIIGMEVYREEDGELLGRVRDVLKTGANDVYVVDLKGGRELLLPAIRDVVRKIDLENNKMVVKLMEGMD